MKYYLLMDIFSGAGKFLVGLVRLCLFGLLGTSFCLIFIIYNIFLPSSKKEVVGISYRTFLLKFANWALGIRFRRQGQIPKGQYLLVSNHRSYIDAAIILSENKIHAVSKKVVSKWPIIGYIARISGTIFIGRLSSKDRSKGLVEIKEAYSDGKSLLNFIQGTTSAAPKIERTRNGSVVAAFRMGIPIYPVSIDYINVESYWLGRDHFLPHFFRTFGNLYTRAKITYHDRVEGDNIQVVIDKIKISINDGLDSYRF